MLILLINLLRKIPRDLNPDLLYSEHPKPLDHRGKRYEIMHYYLTIFNNPSHILHLFLSRRSFTLKFFGINFNFY